jgi:hypothetical protein
MCVKEAGRFVLTVIRVKRHVYYKQKKVKRILLACCLLVSLIIVYFCIYKELTKIICVFKLGYNAFADLNIIILIIVKRRSSV